MVRTIDLGKVVAEGGAGLKSDPREEESAQSPELGGVPINADRFGGRTFTQLYQEIVNGIYPIGRTVMTFADDDNPNTLYPWQKWEHTSKGRMLIGTGTPENNDDGTPAGDYNMALGGKGGNAAHKHVTQSGWDSTSFVHLYEPEGYSSISGAGTYLKVSGAYSNASGGVIRTSNTYTASNMPPFEAVNIWKRVS